MACSLLPCFLSAKFLIVLFPRPENAHPLVGVIAKAATNLLSSWLSSNMSFMKKINRIFPTRQTRHRQRGLFKNHINLFFCTTFCSLPPLCHFLNESSSQFLSQSNHYQCQIDQLRSLLPIDLMYR